MQSGMTITVQNRESVNFGLLDRVKRRLFLDVDMHDDLINDQLNRAIDEVERFTNRAIGPQTRKVSYALLTEKTRLPYPPFTDVVSVTAGGSVDSDGWLTANWVAGGSVIMKCGYTKDTIPAALLDAVVEAAAGYTRLNSDIKTDSWKAIARPLRNITWAS
jgi:hypothetical protein